jgi:hypothetical protein
MSATESSVAESPATKFRSAVEAEDHAAMVRSLAADVLFDSPVVHRRYQGRDAVASLLAAVLQVFEDFHYTQEYASTDGAVLRFACRVGDRDLEGVDILRFGADGLITEFTVMVRPYSAATALRERMAALLAGG